MRDVDHFSSRCNRSDNSLHHPDIVIAITEIREDRNRMSTCGFLRYHSRHTFVLRRIRWTRPHQPERSEAELRSLRRASRLSPSPSRATVTPLDQHTSHSTKPIGSCTRQAIPLRRRLRRSHKDRARTAPPWFATRGPGSRFRPP